MKAPQHEPTAELPVREYIGALSLELAEMARWDGDEALARLLETAAALAGEPLARSPASPDRAADPRAA